MTGRPSARWSALGATARVALVALIACLLAVVTETADAASPPAAFAPPTDYATDAPPRNLAIGDLDGDTHPDLALVGPGDGVAVRFGNGGGTFAAPIELGTGPAPLGVAIGDLDGDADLDLAVTHMSATARAPRPPSTPPRQPRRSPVW